jgi:hypothetical protein
MNSKHIHKLSLNLNNVLKILGFAKLLHERKGGSNVLGRVAQKNSIKIRVAPRKRGRGVGQQTEILLYRALSLVLEIFQILRRNSSQGLRRLFVLCHDCILTASIRVVYNVGGMPMKSRLPISTPHWRMMS